MAEADHAAEAEDQVEAGRRQAVDQDAAGEADEERLVQRQRRRRQQQRKGQRHQMHDAPAVKAAD